MDRQIKVNAGFLSTAIIEAINIEYITREVGGYDLEETLSKLYDLDTDVVKLIIKSIIEESVTDPDVVESDNYTGQARSAIEQAFSDPFITEVVIDLVSQIFMVKKMLFEKFLNKN